jgi:hypothetical protein
MKPQHFMFVSFTQSDPTSCGNRVKISVWHHFDGALWGGGGVGIQ